MEKLSKRDKNDNGYLQMLIDTYEEYAQKAKEQKDPRKKAYWEHLANAYDGFVSNEKQKMKERKERKGFDIYK